MTLDDFDSDGPVHIKGKDENWRDVEEVLDPFAYPYHVNGAKQLTGSQKSKARKLVRDNLIHKAFDSWDILPVPGNKEIRKVWVDAKGIFRCTCQWSAVDGKVCAHILGVWMFEGLIKDGFLEET